MVLNNECYDLKVTQPILMEITLTRHFFRVLCNFECYNLKVTQPILMLITLTWYFFRVLPNTQHFLRVLHNFECENFLTRNLFWQKNATYFTHTTLTCHFFNMLKIQMLFLVHYHVILKYLTSLFLSVLFSDQKNNLGMTLK